MNYDAKIDAQYQRIAKNQQEIAELREKIQELYEALQKTNEVRDNLERAANQSSAKFNNPSGILGFAMSVFRTTFFQQLSDYITGAKYKAALSTLESIIGRISDKIKEMSNQIESLEMEIQDSYRKIDSLRAEKAAEARKEKERKEREAAAAGGGEGGDSA